MADKVLNTKIALLYKSYSQWDAIKSTYIPLKGEVCICEVPAEASLQLQKPCVLFKVGDGTHNFDELQWTSALAADVYAWAKKANLDWADLSDKFRGEAADNSKYQMVGSNGVWKLQKYKYDSERETWAWVDVSTIDVASYITPLLNKKVDREVVLDSGATSLVSNNKGDNGAVLKIEGTGDNAKISAVAVNDGDIGAQIYDLKQSDKSGVILDVTRNGIYYHKGEFKDAAARDVADNELVVKKDIKDIAGGMHFIGVGTWVESATMETMITPIYQSIGKTYDDRKAGDLVILKSSETDREFVCVGAKGDPDTREWVELGEQGIYAKQADLEDEIDRAKAAEAKKADLPGECPPWLNPTGETPYPWFMASLDVESEGHGPTADGHIKAGVGAYNFNGKQYYKWEKDLNFAATQSKSGLMVATDKEKLDNIATVDGDFLIINCNY